MAMRECLGIPVDCVCAWAEPDSLTGRGFILDRLMLDMTRLAIRTTGEAAATETARVEVGRDPERTASVGMSFEELLSASMKEVNVLQLEADDKIRRLATGDVEDISEVVMASSRAEVALKLMMELRNKFVDAYQALSRIAG